MVGKQSFLGSAVGLSYPIEVCAALDFGLATTAPLYLGEPSMSSFDAFAQGERRLRGRKVDTVPAICGTGAGPGA